MTFLGGKRGVRVVPQKQKGVVRVVSSKAKRGLEVFSLERRSFRYIMYASKIPTTTFCRYHDQ